MCTYQSNSLQGRDDVFCLMQLSPLTLQGGQNKQKREVGIKGMNASTCHQNWTEALLKEKYQVYFPASPALLSPIQAFIRLLYKHRCLIYWPGAPVTAVRPSQSQRFSFTLLIPLLLPVLSPVLSLLLRVVKQDSDDVEEAAQHFQSKVKHSHSQTCNPEQTAAIYERS